MTSQARAWLKKYYPIPAKKCSAGKALSHSIRKWEGLCVTEAYDLRLDGTEVQDKYYKSVLNVDSDTCALCTHYQLPGDYTPCLNCPLYIVRGEVRCDVVMVDEATSPYHAFVDNQDPFAMLSWLLRAENKKGRKKQ